MRARGETKISSTTEAEKTRSKLINQRANERIK